MFVFDFIFVFPEQLLLKNLMFLLWGLALNGFEISEEQQKYVNKDYNLIKKYNTNVLTKDKGS